jgi:hypothetical protein
MFNSYFYFLEVLSLLVAIFYIKQYKESYYTYFVAYLFTLVFIETLGVVLRQYGILSAPYYNIYTFFEYNLIAIIYYKLTKERKSHKLIFYLIGLFNIFYFIGFYFRTLQDYSYLLGAITVCVFMIVYLKELLKSDSILIFQKHLPFWITVAFLIYYLTTVPFYLVLFVIKIGTREESQSLFLVQKILVVLTNLCYIYGLIWSSKQKS